MNNTRKPSAFTLIEFVVGISVLTIIVATVLPAAMSAREAERRTRCMDNLRKIGLALSQYGMDNDYALPRGVYDASVGETYNAFTGAHADNPFEPGSAVAPNDVTASLWLLVRGNYISSEFSPASAVFTCPSTSDFVDPVTDAQGAPVGAVQRSNFRGPRNLSYSYSSPFSNASGYALKLDFIARGFVLLADKNPGSNREREASPVTADAPPLQIASANSVNHRRAGQNVLFGDMHVEFTTTPYCGVNGDNIYTAAATPSTQPTIPATQGFLGRSVLPSGPTDSYLVPTATD